MLGEQIIDWKGKVAVHRVLNEEGPTTETTVSFKGSVRSTPVQATVTFVGKPTSGGVLHGEGNGVIMAEGSEMARYTGVGFGKIDPSGNIKWRGSHFYKTESNGKFAFLNNVVGLFEADMDVEGNVTENIWEWK